MSLEQVRTRTPYGRLTVLLGCAFVLSVALTWTFLAMRAVMDVGGTCAEGGPYVIAQPCPDGAVLISVAIPVMIIAAMLGSAFAVWLSAPNLLLPMWVILFGTLGWNFLEYGFSDDGVVWGWIVCGVVFELMALPALAVMLVGTRFKLIPVAIPGVNTAGQPRQPTWYAAYVVLGVAGAAVGWWSFDALS
jgi:hypothetical protein